MGLETPQNWANQPVGMRDIYPHQARLRRHIETVLIENFEQQGFDMVSSGAFEYVDTLLRGRRNREVDDWVRWFDSNGKMVALRPDMTPSIARMAAPILASGVAEVRWCYAEKVYHRTDNPASLSWLGGKAAESTQVGVEWIGKDGTATDVALLSICRGAAAKLKLQDWQMVISHAKLAPLLMQMIGVNRQTVDGLIHCLVQGDYVTFRQIQAQATDADVLSLLSSVNPFSPEALPAAFREGFASHEVGRETSALWEELRTLSIGLQEAGLEDHVAFDFTLYRDLSYYTGIVFEMFVPGVGAPVALGGRYDELLSHFGTNAPAVGFTFEVERLLSAITSGTWLRESEQRGERL